MATLHPQWQKSSFKRGEVSSQGCSHPLLTPPSTKGTFLEKQPPQSSMRRWS